MSDYFVGEIKLFPYGRIPTNFAPCNGQILKIQSNAALFSILGTQYGGDGRTTFALPNLQGRVVVHSDQPTNGLVGGEESHTLTLAEMPEHSHGAIAAGDATTTNPENAVWGTSTTDNYGLISDGQMSDDALMFTGGNLPHTNMQPYLTFQYGIAIHGIYPSRN